MNRTTNQLRRQLLDTISRLTATLHDLPTATDNLTDAQPGYPTNTSGGGGTNLDAAGNPPGLDRYITAADPAAHDQRRLHQLITQTHNAAIDLVDIVGRWTAPDIEGSRNITRQASGGDCLACDRYCSGASSDRLRSGLCDACRKHWTRWIAHHSQGDRGDWMLERRRMVRDEPDSNAA